MPARSPSGSIPHNSPAPLRIPLRSLPVSAPPVPQTTPAHTALPHTPAPSYSTPLTPASSPSPPSLPLPTTASPALSQPPSTLLRNVSLAAPSSPLRTSLSHTPATLPA